MEDPLDTHHNEGLYDLFKYSEDFLNAQLFIFLLIVIQKIALLTVFHNYLHLFALLVEMGVIDLDQVGMHELFHDLDLLQCLIALEGVDVDAFQGEGSFFAVLDEINASETSFADSLNRFVMLHCFSGVLSN